MKASESTRKRHDSAATRRTFSLYQSLFLFLYDSLTLVMSFSYTLYSIYYIWLDHHMYPLKLKLCIYLYRKLFVSLYAPLTHWMFLSNAIHLISPLSVYTYLLSRWLCMFLSHSLSVFMCIFSLSPFLCVYHTLY